MTSKEKQQFYQHIRGLACEIEAGDHALEAAAETILILWSKHQCPALKCSGFSFSKHFASLRKTKSFVFWLCQRELLESAYWLSSAYAIWSGPDYRKEMAMFFTPPSITKRLLDDLELAGVSFAEHSFCDPACGGAAFLVPIAQRMRAEMVAKGATSRQILEKAEKKLFGTDLDGVLCKMSRHFLRMVMSEEIVDARYEPKFHVDEADSLSALEAVFGQIDVVVCNPPYRKMLSNEVALHLERFADVIEAQPNLYGLFIALCLRLLKPGGLAALVTPTSFLSGKSFTKLRGYLMEHSEIRQIGIIADRSGVFINVEQETALTLLRQRAPKHAEVTTATVAVISRDGVPKSVGKCDLPNSGSAWPIPRNEEDVEILQLAGASAYRLSDYGYRARIGALVWNRDKRRTFLSLGEAKANTKTFTPLLWSSDVKLGKKVSFSTKPKTNDEASFVEVTDYKNPSIVKRPAAILQRVTSNDQGRRLVAAAVPASLLKRYKGFVGENHTVILESIDDSSFPLKLLVALLSSRKIDRYYRCISGATNVSVFELRQLPLPSPEFLKCALDDGLSMEDAVSRAFGQGQAASSIHDTWHMNS